MLSSSALSPPSALTKKEIYMETETNLLAVVTGASSGIGLEFAKILAANGYSLVLVARDQALLEETAKNIRETYSVNAEAYAIDLSLADSADSLWSTLKMTPNVLVNNAGIGDYGNVVDADPGKIRTMIELNVQAMTRLAQLAAIDMKKRGSGSILNTASTAAFLPGPGMAAYYASKAYVLSFSEALSEELKGSGVRVTALCPGPTKTHFQETAHAQKNAVFNRNLPSPEEVAAFGYKAVLSGKVVAVHGFSNKLSVFLPRFMTRASVRRWVAKAQKI